MENFIKSTKTFRFEQMGTASVSRKIIYLMHGYGQLAKDFIQQFSFLKEEVLLVAPEGMHRFYLRGTSGPIGASWMTREDRVHDIADKLLFLKKLKEKIDTENPECKSYVLGFSQGGSSAMRWMLSDPSFEQAFICCSSYPTDLNGIPETKKTSLYFLGNQDHYFTEESRKLTLAAYKEAGFRTIEFDGGHQIEAVILKDILLHLHQ